jgi:hypothetical protein
MAYGIILKHLEMDKITWGGNFLKKKIFFNVFILFLRGALTAFSAGKRGRAPFF